MLCRRTCGWVLASICAGFPLRRSVSKYREKDVGAGSISNARAMADWPLAVRRLNHRVSPRSAVHPRRRREGEEGVCQHIFILIPKLSGIVDHWIIVTVCSFRLDRCHQINASMKYGIRVYEPRASRARTPRYEGQALLICSPFFRRQGEERWPYGGGSLRTCWHHWERLG